MHFLATHDQSLLRMHSIPTCSLVRYESTPYRIPQPKLRCLSRVGNLMYLAMLSSSDLAIDCDLWIRIGPFPTRTGPPPTRISALLSMVGGKSWGRGGGVGKQPDFGFDSKSQRSDRPLWPPTPLLSPATSLNSLESCHLRV